MEVDEVLGQIAEALEDWSVGPDAMRCGAAPDDSNLNPNLTGVFDSNAGARFDYLRDSLHVPDLYQIHVGTTVLYDGTRLQVVGEPVWEDGALTFTVSRTRHARTAPPPAS